MPDGISIGDRVIHCLRMIHSDMKTELRSDTNFREVLDFDDLDCVEFLYCLEDEFGIEMTDEELHWLVTIDEVVKWIDENA